MAMKSDPPDPMVQRSIELEARFSWLERHVTEQDKVILELGDELRSVRREVQELRKRLNNAGEANSDGELESRPPHF
jgi:uncharacterized coiled-coil protein SlyX